MEQILEFSFFATRPANTPTVPNILSVFAIFVLDTFARAHCTVCIHAVMSISIGSCQGEEALGWVAQCRSPVFLILTGTPLHKIKDLVLQAQNYYQLILESL
eukprot:2744548-Amphidinium_carterae.2